MWDLMYLFPMAVGAIMIAVLLYALCTGKIGFLTKTLGIQYDQTKQRFDLSTGPVFGTIILGALLIVAPIVIDQFLVTKRTFFLGGKVQLEDGSSPQGVRIVACYPLTDVFDDGSFEEVRLCKNEAGRFPVVAFELPGYVTRHVRIDDDSTAKSLSALTLKDAIVLSKKPGN